MNNVPRLVYTSSVDSVSPLKDCIDLEEVKWYYPKASELAMPEYAITKQKAERLVIGSHGRPLAKALHGGCYLSNQDKLSDIIFFGKMCFLLYCIVYNNMH